MAKTIDVAATICCVGPTSISVIPTQVDKPNAAKGKRTEVRRRNLSKRSTPKAFALRPLYEWDGQTEKKVTS